MVAQPTIDATRDAGMTVEFNAMGGPCELRLAGLPADSANRLARAAIEEVHRVEAKFSRYRADSIVSRINAAAGGKWIACDDETNALLDYSDAMHAASDGLFDVTSGILRRAWDFDRSSVPSAARLAELLPLVGWTRVQRRSGEVRLPERGMEIDFGGFGKEYAADRAAALLLDGGALYGLVSLGGDVRVLGPRPDGRPWSIGIQDPRDPGRIAAHIEVIEGALATSGDYERYFDLDGQRYCHILDPHSGMPVAAWRSVSVLAPLTVVAGGHATVAMLKQAIGLNYLDSAGVPYFSIDAGGHFHYKNIGKH